MSMFACINEWIILQKRTKITISTVPIKSLLTNLALVKYISILRQTKNFKNSGILFEHKLYLHIKYLHCHRKNGLDKNGLARPILNEKWSGRINICQLNMVRLDQFWLLKVVWPDQNLSSVMMMLKSYSMGVYTN